MNMKYDIKDAPGNIVGVQQKLQPRLKLLLAHLSENWKTKGKTLPSTIHIRRWNSDWARF